MDATTPNAVSNDIEEQRKAAIGYQPDVDGDNVGPKVDIRLLQAEFTDPIHQKNTASIATRTPIYRKIKGDGSCGWRALFFGYFELLASNGSTELLGQEINRLSTICRNLKLDEMIWEDWLAAAIDLLGKLKASDQANKASIIREAFNTDETSSELITLLRTIVADWLLRQREEMEQWLDEGLSMDQYCSIHVNPVTAELEELTLQATFRCLLQPAGMAVNVYYLDRNDQSAVEPLMYGDRDVPSIDLLYRPGHYDMLYAGPSVQGKD